MTWESFEKLPDGDGMHRELIEGELQILAPPKSGHTKVAKRAYRQLVLVEDRAGEDKRILRRDTNFLLTSAVGFNPTFRFFETTEFERRWTRTTSSARPTSRSRSSRHRNRPPISIEKSRSFSKPRVLPCGFSNPKQRSSRILPSGASYRKGIGETLSLPELLPDSEFPAARLFED
jgi:hypothetical protein